MRRILNQLWKDEIPFIAFLLALFLTLTALVLILLSGRSRRESLLIEYEAQKIASALLESVDDADALGSATLEGQILGFGLYNSEGMGLQRLGSAPRVLQIPEELTNNGSGAAVRFQKDSGSMILIRWVGVMPGMAGMHRRMPGSMQSFMRGQGASRFLFLELDIGAYWSTRRLLAATNVLAPLLILAMTLVIGNLYMKNIQYRRELSSQQRLAQLGEISRTLAHEIKNPLSAIRIQTGILSKTLPADGQNDLLIIEEEVDRLNHLTDRIGDFLRDPLGRPDLVDLDAFIRELIRRYDREIGFARVDIGNDDIDAETGHVVVMVRFDIQRLRSVLENLISNALQSTEDVSSGESVGIELRPTRNRVEIVVLDRGPGIPDENKDRIFDPFFTSKIRGSGVGLSISKRFIEAAGGSLAVDNRRGGGTEVRIVLDRKMS